MAASSRYSNSRRRASRLGRTLHVEYLEERRLLTINNVSGDIPDGAIWAAGDIQRITGNARVPAGATLTIRPGAIVQFNSFAGLGMLVEGTLDAQGTAANPILVTSVRDDTGFDGLAGTADDIDTAGDGATTAGNGDWNSIRFASSSTDNVFEHLDVRFGGSSAGAVVAETSGLTLTDSVISRSATQGVRVLASNPTLTGTTLGNNTGAAISMDLASQPSIDDATLTGNGINALVVEAGTLVGDRTWDQSDVVYVLGGTITVAQGSTLTVAPGQIIKGGGFNFKLIVAGTLKADGEAAQPIIFTNRADDTAGGDTYGDGAGDDRDAWGGIELTATSTASVLDFVEVRQVIYAATAQVFVNGGELTMTNSKIINSAGELAATGMRIQGSSPTLLNNVFANNKGVALSMDLASSPTISGITLTGNGLNGLSVDGGTLPGSRAWDDADIVYWMTGAVTVPVGTTLTIGAGQIIKGAFLSSGFLVDGTLLAAGTAEQPIILTSRDDDTAGGDTNANGPVSIGLEDWAGIAFRAGSTGNVLDHIDGRYVDSNPGAGGLVRVTGAGASAELRNSIIRNAAGFGVGAYNTGSLTLTSNLIVGSGNAGVLAESGGVVTAVNNTIDGNFQGVLVRTGSTANLRNNLITNNSNSGVFAENLAAVTAVFNDVFNPQNVNYFGLVDQTGANGNRSIDPKYFNRANRQYQLLPGSPIVDVASSDSAPTTDHLGNPRFDDPNVINQGGGTSPFFDMGAFERQETSTSDVDLAVLGVSGPTTGVPDEVVTVNWSVDNLGIGSAVGPWSDAIYLSDQPVFSPSARLLGRLTHTGDLGPSQSYAASKQVTLSGVLPGRHYFIVRTNDLGDVFEGAAVSNNAAASSAAIDFTLPTLTLGTPLADQFTGAGQSHYYQLTVQSGQSLIVTLDSAATGGVTELFVSQNALPSRSQSDFRATAATPDQNLIVPTTGAGTYYVLAYANSGAAAASAFTIKATSAAFDIRGVAPGTATNAGRVTVAIEGSRFTRDTQASLVDGVGGEINAVAIQFGDASKIFATFDLAGVAIGSYSVRVRDVPFTDTLAGALTVTPGVVGHLTTRIIVPSSIRTGFAGSLTIEYENDGGADLVAPLMLLQSNNAFLRLATQTAFEDSSLELLGINSSGPAGVLPPGARGSIKVVFLPKAGGDVNFDLTQVDLAQPFDWNAAKANLRPADVPADAWDAIFANFVTSVGDTAGEYQAALAQDATYLSELGEYVSDPARLLAFELAKAGNFGAISQRYQLGALGRGISDPTDIRAEVTAEGNVVIHSGGRLRSFFVQPGGFKGEAGDSGTLKLINGAYRLREADGTVIQFRVDGNLDYVEDPSRNRMTASYQGGRMSGLTDSFGDTIGYAYNAQSRINQITDPVGRVTTLTYDASGEHLISLAEPGGTTLFTYVTGQGLAREHAVATVTLPNGTVRTFLYDTRGRVTRTFIGAGAEDTRYTYFGAAGVTALNALDEGVSLLLNDLGQTAILQDPLGRITRFFYDSNHQLVRRQGPDGAIATMNYDSAGNLARATNPLGQQIDVSVEGSLSRLTSIRDPRGGVLNLSSDSRGRLRSFALADGSTQRFTYDTEGNLIDTVNRRGQATHSTYDAKNLLTRIDYADGTFTAFTYDAHRNLASTTDASGTALLTYDTADRLTNITYPGGRSLTYTYDAAGRRATSVDQDGFTVKYSYDAVGRLEELKDAADARIVKYSYDSTGRISREDRGNGAFTVYSYFDDGQVQSIVHRAASNALLSRFDYTYDTLGRPITVADAAGGTTTYGYDALGQLTSVVLPGGRVITYQYDSMGNRVSVTDAGVTTSYSTNNLNQYTSAGPATFTYDADGNLVTKTDTAGTTTYTYDVRGRLVAVDGPSEDLVFEYDVFGNRAAVTRNGQRTQYLADPTGVGDVIAEYDAAGQAIARYTYGAGLVSRVDAVGSPAYFTFDAIGNTAQLLGAGSSVLNAYGYLPFGELTSSSETFANPFTFGGEHGVMRDSDGLFFMQARHYDANLGRFTAIDPAGLNGGDVNLYRYVENSPTVFVDPAGLTATVPLKAPPGGFGTRPARPPTIRVPRPDVFARLEQALQAMGTQAEIQQALLKGGTITVGVLVIATNAYYDYQGKTRPSDLVAQTVIYGGIAISGYAIGETATLVYGAGSFAAFGGSVIATFGAAGFAAAGGYLAGHYANKAIHSDFVNRYFPAKKIAERTSGAIVDTFFAPERTKLGQRGKIWRDGVALGLTDEEIRRKLSEAGLSQKSPVDPNDISGPLGFGPQHFVSSNETLPYTILFENKPDATAAAVLVTITHQLDADLDWSTFEVGDFGFADLQVEVPAGLRFYSTRVDYTKERGEYVDVTATIDLDSGLATWTFMSIDPETGQPATDVDAGFLLPDINAPEGEGFANYSIRPKSNLPTGTLINAQASIVFDFNDPLETPVFVNTIDALAPTSSIPTLAATEFPRFRVSWQAADDTGGSGVGRFDIYVSVDGGAYQLWLDKTQRTAEWFLGPAGHEYAFYALGTDNVGNTQAAPAVATTTTTTTAAPWQYSNDQLNVNADTVVTPLDALIIINELNAGGPRDLPAPQNPPEFWFDVSGNNRLAAQDALIIINFLNDYGSSPSQVSVNVDGLDEGSLGTAFVTAPAAAEESRGFVADVVMSEIATSTNSSIGFAAAHLTEIDALLAGARSDGQASSRGSATSTFAGPFHWNAVDSWNSGSSQHHLLSAFDRRVLTVNERQTLFAEETTFAGSLHLSNASKISAAAASQVLTEEDWSEFRELDFDPKIDQWLFLHG